MQNFNATLGNGNVVFLRNMEVSVSHLIAEQVGGRVHLSHSCSISVAKKMELEVYAQLFLDFSCGVLKLYQRC